MKDLLGCLTGIGLFIIYVAAGLGITCALAAWLCDIEPNKTYTWYSGIWRKTIPSNADPTRTHLNRELIGEAGEVRNRDHAITERIQSAGIKRKITPNQVRAIRIMLSGTHEDMMQVQQSGCLNKWCCNGCTKSSDGRTPFPQSYIWTNTHHIYTPPLFPS